MTIYYTSDLHIGHKTVAGHRGFFLWEDGPENPPTGYDPDSHDAHLAAYWDATVTADDTVYVLGDTGMGRFESHVLPWFDARLGIKHLVAGNHDPVHPSRSNAVKLQRRWLKTFDTINPYLTRKIAGQKVALSHFPYESFGDGGNHGEPGGRWNEWRIPEELGKFLLHGHTHGVERAHHTQFHVGWDAWGRFVTQDEIAMWLQPFSD